MKSRSTFLKQADVKAAIAACPRVETLAIQFDELHLKVQKGPTAALKKKKLSVKTQLDDAIAKLSIAA